jgi:hypothetical protein
VLLQHCGQIVHELVASMARLAAHRMRLKKPQMLRIAIAAWPVQSTHQG